MKTIRGYINIKREAVRDMITLARGHCASLLCVVQINAHIFLSQNLLVRCSSIRFGSTLGQLMLRNVYMQFLKESVH